MSQPHSKKYQPQKYVKRYPPPPEHPFFSLSLSLFLHFSKKILKFRGGGGVEPPEPPPPLKYALGGTTVNMMLISFMVHGVKLFDDLGKFLIRHTAIYYRR